MWTSNRRFLAGSFVLNCSLVLLLLPRSSDAHLTLENITITVPNGTTDHGDPHLLCLPAKWSDIALFFFGNYLAHAATVKSLPGEPALSVEGPRLPPSYIPHPAFFGDSVQSFRGLYFASRR